MEEDNPINKLLSEEEQLEMKELELKKKKDQTKVPKSDPKEIKEIKKQKTEETAMETPQDRFRKIINDSGFKTGIENLTSFFFRGDTDSPEWLDYTLKVANIPPKNREIILSNYYGKTISELGIKIEELSNKSKDEKKTETEKAAANLSGDADLDKLINDDAKSQITALKMDAAIEVINARKAKAKAEQEEIEERRRQRNIPQSTTMMMRQIQRPVIVNGSPLLNKEGTIIYETVQEPVPTGQSGGDNMTGLAAILAAIMPKINTPSSGDSEVAKAIAAMNQQIEGIRKSTELQSKEDEIKRLNDRLDKEKEDAKKDLQREKEAMKEKLDKIEENRLRDLQDLKERFKESIEHKKELDDVVGQISSAHKKELDGLKQKLEHTSTNLEKIIVSRSTETLDGVTKKVGDIAEEVVKPMAEVMRDHYRTVIDQTRATTGLPPLKDSIPKVGEEDLESFVRGE